MNVQAKQYWRVRVNKRGRTMLGKVTSVKPRGILLRRVTADGDEFGKSDELHVLLVAEGDLVAQLEMDNFYGMLVPLGTAKKHICNHNL